jgi:riboflavin kinase/FMN adenylyltransferase
MRVARSLEEAAADFAPTAVTIGNFDGVHLGHRQLLDRVVEAATKQHLNPAVLTFDPHPASVVARGRTLKLLTKHAERCTRMAREGIEWVLVMPFTSVVALWSPEQFVERVLVKALGAKLVVVGDNFRFGHNQAGDTKVLTELGHRFGFETQVVPPVRFRGRVVSSSEIRRAIEAGQATIAGRLLGRPFALEGAVVTGHGIGSKQTVPTLNLKTLAEVLPENGVYVTRTTDRDTIHSATPRQWNSITNVGMRPTFNGDQLTIETFLLDPFTPPDPEQIRVEFLHRVRDERKFESPEALKSQILKDVGLARAYFRRTRRWVHADSK